MLIASPCAPSFLAIALMFQIYVSFFSPVALSVKANASCIWMLGAILVVDAFPRSFSLMWYFSWGTSMLSSCETEE